MSGNITIGKLLSVRISSTQDVGQKSKELICIALSHDEPARRISALIELDPLSRWIVEELTEAASIEQAQDNLSLAIGQIKAVLEVLKRNN